jgi:hypothetical protein
MSVYLLVTGCGFLHIIQEHNERKRATREEAVKYYRVLYYEAKEWGRCLNGFSKAIYLSRKKLDSITKNQEKIGIYLDTLQKAYITYQQKVHSIVSKLNSLKEVDSSIFLKQHEVAVINEGEIFIDSLIQTLYFTLSNNPLEINSKSLRKKMKLLKYKTDKKIEKHRYAFELFCFKYYIWRDDIYKTIKK